MNNSVIVITLMSTQSAPLKWRTLNLVKWSEGDFQVILLIRFYRVELHRASQWVPILRRDLKPNLQTIFLPIDCKSWNQCQFKTLCLNEHKININIIKPVCNDHPRDPQKVVVEAVVFWSHLCNKSIQSGSLANVWFYINQSNGPLKT